MNVLIIGIDSFLGKALAENLTVQGHKVTGTSRRRDADNCLYFDLEQPCKNWPKWDENLDVAFIAAGITKQDICENDPEFAYFINVEQMIRLISKLRDNGISIIFPSTNIVLPCTTPNQPITQPVAPIGIYADHKAKVEKYLSDKPDTTIARLPKILDGSFGLVKEWKNKLMEGDSISAINNLYISPVSTSYAVHFLSVLIAKKPGGIWHLSGAGEYNYADLAKALSELAGKGREMVKTYHADNLNAATPRHPSLDCSLTEKQFGIKPQPFIDVVENCYYS